MLESNVRSVRGQSAVPAAIRVLVVFEAVTFLLASSLHLGLGATLPFGLVAPRIIPAAVVEGLAGLFCAGSAAAIFTRKPWAWYAAVAANTFALFGVLLGVWALALGLGPSTELNGVYHRMMLAALAALVACMLLLLTPAGRTGLDNAPDR
jgi:hypothetical protein